MGSMAAQDPVRSVPSPRFIGRTPTLVDDQSSLEQSMTKNIVGPTLVVVSVPSCNLHE